MNYEIEKERKEKNNENNDEEERDGIEKIGVSLLIMRMKTKKRK